MEIIVTGLAFHSAGVFLYQLSTKTNKKDRPYTAFAYLPKVTTQNVLAAVPLSIELPCRNIIQSVAVFGILTTAPLVAILMDVAKNILLKWKQLMRFLAIPHRLFVTQLSKYCSSLS